MADRNLTDADINALADALAARQAPAHAAPDAPVEAVIAPPPPKDEELLSLLNIAPHPNALSTVREWIDRHFPGHDAPEEAITEGLNAVEPPPAQT